MHPFKVHSDFDPAGDQPEAIAQLAAGIERGDRFQTLMGITGSGKSATVAWLIEQIQRPTIVLAPNKALAAQLANERHGIWLLGGAFEHDLDQVGRIGPVPVDRGPCDAGLGVQPGRRQRAPTLVEEEPERDREQLGQRVAVRSRWATDAYLRVVHDAHRISNS